MPQNESQERDSTPPIRTFESLPEGGLTHAQYKSLEHVEKFTCAPLVEDMERECITHLSFMVGDAHHFIGWDPQDEHWEQIAAFEFPEEMDEGCVETDVIEVYDDETGEPVLQFELDEENFVESIHTHVRKHAEHVHEDTERLWFIMEEGQELAKSRDSI